MSAIDLEELKVRATRAHRMSCSDPDDPTRETPYSVQLKLVAALEAVQGIVKVLEKIQREDNVSKNACAGAIAIELQSEIEEALS